jgi:hypothetical protein
MGLSIIPAALYALEMSPNTPVFGEDDAPFGQKMYGSEKGNVVLRTFPFGIASIPSRRHGIQRSSGRGFA